MPATDQPPAAPSPRTPWWLWPQVLSLDAPAVSVAWMAVLARGHHIKLPPAFYWGLALITWIVYVLDRTADAISGRLPEPLSQRHRFYQRHSKLYLRLLLPAFVNGWLWIVTHAAKDFTTPLLLASSGSQLVANVIYGRFTGGRLPESAAAMVLLVVLLIAVVAVGRRWTGETGRA